ncbi:MAG: prolyl oligopeptidase family serine peptidase [Halobacteriaceae archaeon]
MDRIASRDYHDIASVGDPQLHPDGDRVAFVRSEPDGSDEYESTIYIAPLGGGEARRFTAAEGADSQPRWSPNGSRLAFVSADRGEEEPSAQLWIMPTDGGEAERVTDVVGGVSNITWSPDGSKIAFTQSVRAAEREEGYDLETDEEYEREEPDPRLIDRLVYRQGQSYRDGAHSHVYVYDVETGSVEGVTPGIDEDADLEYDYTGPTFSDSGTLHYAVCRAPDPDDSYEYDVDAYDLAAEEAETLFTTTGWPIVRAHESGAIAYAYRPEDRATMRQTQLKVYDPETDEHVTPTAALDRTINGVEWAPDGDSLFVLTPDEGGVVVRRLPLEEAAEDDVVLGGGRHVTGLDVGEDAIAVAQSEWDHPGDIFAATPAGEEEVRLTRVNDEYLAEKAVAEPEEIRFDSEGAEGLQGWLLTPPDFDPEEEYPLIVEIHGGPHVMWTTSGTMWHEWQSLAAAGYCVFWSNPRGSTGYGEEHTMAIYRDWGDVTLTDVMAGVETVTDRPYIDEDDAFVTGGSFGGYMVGWTVGQTDFFKGACAQRGVYDFASFYGSTDAFKLIEGDYGATPWEEPGFLWEQSPVANAGDVETPTLVVHSEYDFRVPVNNGEMFYLFLKKNDVDTRLVRYPREGHELSRSGEPDHVVDRLERIRRWFDGYSDHKDVPPALEREPEEGLDLGDEDEDGDEDANSS